MNGFDANSATGNALTRWTARVLCLAAVIATSSTSNAQDVCARNLSAEVVALDMPLMWNRLGAQNINGMMFALKEDVVKIDSDGKLTPMSGFTEDEVKAASGNVTLRPDKRPRPLVLRTGEGDCLTITLYNLLNATANPFPNPANGGDRTFRSNVEFRLHNDNQVAERKIGLRFTGTELVSGIKADTSNVGENPDGTIGPGASTTYTIRTPSDGAYVGVSYGGKIGGEGQGGTTASGLFAVLNVNPQDSAFYRNALTNEDLALATRIGEDGLPMLTEDGHPVLNYEAVYPNDEPWISEGKAGLPIINMVQNNKIVHTAIDAIVAYGPEFTLDRPREGEGAEGLNYLGHFPRSIYPLESKNLRNPTVPNRLEPFREFTVAFHDEVQTNQAFPGWYTDPVFSHTLHGVKDAFMINYGSGGIGSEILANRLGVGPMHDCVNCAYEEFFLTFHTVGEVGQLVDVPANMNLENCDPNLQNCGAVGPKASYVLYPEDPSNVHHSYVGDPAAFRNLHIGPGEHHVFHLHNHQWLFNANDDNSNYLDAQGIGPGSGYGYWINFGGSGNRNRTAGDAIFHCHFYPHFAQGMWEMWRIHDAYETGTELLTTALGIEQGLGGHVPFTTDGIGLGNGTPFDVNGDEELRALPDGEITAGAPTPAVVPLPGKPMPPMPAKAVSIQANHNEVKACFDGDNQVLRNEDGLCPTGDTISEKWRPVGSLTVVDRSKVFVDPKRPNDPVAAKTVGYPFWVAGMEHTVGNRPPTPPLDMITYEQGQALPNPAPGGLWSHPAWTSKGVIRGWDGGLPRFAVEGYAAGGETLSAVTRLDMSKDIKTAKPVFFPEEGTDLEQVAMAHHAKRCHDTYRLEDGGAVAAECVDDPNVPGGAGLSSNTKGGFLTNGGLPIAGAPFQEPCMDDRGVLLEDGVTGHFFSGKRLAPLYDTSAMNTTGQSPYSATSPRVYKAANVQFDAVLNKLGYHFPQQRILTLWQDVVPTITQDRPPEPFVMRMNTFDCAQYVHSNVVPKAYELDDYQIRTPTDIIGQHIHLPKWDLVSADGAANGWNYEDGTLAPEAVVEMIEAINRYNAKAKTDPNKTPVTAMDPEYVLPSRPNGTDVIDSTGVHSLTETGYLEPSEHPFFGRTEFGGCYGETKGPWCGARSTMQRWFADPVVNVQGTDRGLGIIFTHDHYGPSTHQQIGLYATLLIEPAGSRWYHNETGEELYSRTDSGDHVLNDGGPTSWQAAILTGEDDRYTENVKATEIEPHREFYFEYSDFQHAYQKEKFVGYNYKNVVGQANEADPLAGLSVDQKLARGVDLDEFNPGANKILPDIDTRKGEGPDTFRDAIQPSYRQQASLRTSIDDTNGGFPVDIWEFPPYCPGDTRAGGNGSVPRPCPEAISADDPGMYVVNYRNESLLARIYDPKGTGPDRKSGAQAAGLAGDVAFAMDSEIARALPQLNSVQGDAPSSYFDSGECDNGVGGSVFCPPINNPENLEPGDPFTPTAFVVDGNLVKVKMQAGGQEEEHGGLITGLKWLQGGSGFGESLNSGWRNYQGGGISEQFTLRTPVYADDGQRGNAGDYAYSMNPSIDGWTNGTWGLIRSLRQGRANPIFPLPGTASQTAGGTRFVNASEFNGVCPVAADVVTYNVVAVQANDVLRAPDPIQIQIRDLYPNAHTGSSPDPDGGTLIFNPRTRTVTANDTGNGGGKGPLHDPTAILYVEADDLGAVDAHGHDIYVKTETVTEKVGRKWKTRTITVHEAWALESGSYAKNHELTADDWDALDPACVSVNEEGDYILAVENASCPLKLRQNVALEPMVFRAAAGDCVVVNIKNRILQPARRVHESGSIPVYAIEADSSAELAINIVEAEDLELAFTPEQAGAYYADENGNGMLEDSLEYSERLDVSDIQWDQTIDLASGNAITAAVRRNEGSGEEGMTSFNNNLIRPSAYVGMVPQLVEFDITRAGSSAMGGNAGSLIGPGGKGQVQWYAGILKYETAVNESTSEIEVTLRAEPIEYGGFNIFPADRIEQGQKSLVAAGVVYPEGATWTVDEGRTTSATVTVGTHSFRDFTTIASKGVSMFYADSFPVENNLGEGTFGVAEDAQDMGHMNINYGNEAMWFRYGINPTQVSGNAKCGGDGPDACLGGLQNAYEAYSNRLDDGAGEAIGDPETAVFTVEAGQEFRMHVLMPHSPGRGSTYDLHGHNFQRDPYICPYDAAEELPGKCYMGPDGLPGGGSTGSQNLGVNPVGMAIGASESWMSGAHYEVFIPKAGGAAGIPGDYLFRDHMGLGNTGGLWGIVRVTAGAPPEEEPPPPEEEPPNNNRGGKKK